MMENTAKLIILNLAGELTVEFSGYFEKRGIQVVEPTNEEQLEWTHILAKGVADFSSIGLTYKTLENDIKIISLSAVDDIQNFVISNGKLILDELWMKGVMGEFILDKFFQEYAGINLGDNYPTFKEKGSFNVTNPFSTGDYMDQLVHQAFTDGVAALSVRTFFDHLLMYLTGLKNKSKVGLPIEVTYGAYEDVFAVQLHFFSQNLLVEDVTGCLSNKISKKAEEHLLNTSIQSSDFFDFTFLSQVNKVVITALWTKDERIKFENRGVMFANLAGAVAIAGYPTEGTTSTLIGSPEILDMSEKINLPDGPITPEGDIIVSGEKFVEVLAEKISSSLELEKVKQLVKGDFNEDDFTQIVSGSVDTEDGKVVLGSMEEMEEIVNIVKGKFDEEKEIIRISGEKFNPDKFAFKVSSGLTSNAKGDNSLKLKSLGEKLPETIKTGLFDFAKKLNKKIDDLSEDDVNTFQDFEMPDLIKSKTHIISNDHGAILKDLKMKFETSLRSEYMEDSMDTIMEMIKTPEDELKVKELLKTTLKSSLESNFRLSEKNSISVVEQDLLVKSLSNSFAEDEQKMREIVTNKEVIQTSQKENSLFNIPAPAENKALQKKLTKVTEENSELKSKMRTLAVELKTLKSTNVKLAEIQARVSEASASQKSAIADNDEQLRVMFQQKLDEQKALTEDDRKKLSALLERESKLIAGVKSEEVKLRRLELESSQKDILFSQELEKSNRTLKAKDLMLLKTRESLMKTTEKKDREVQEMKLKVEQANRALATGPSQVQANTIRDLEKEKQNLTRMLDVYKIKVSSLATNMQSNKSDDGSAKEEVRRLQMINNQFKNQIEVNKREALKFQERLAQEMAQIGQLRVEKTRLEQILKKTNFEVQKEKEKEVKPQAATGESDLQLKQIQHQNQLLENQLKDTTTKLKDVEIRLLEAQKNQKTMPSADETKGKVHQLEGNVKKLTQDLIESRNQLTELKKEANKLRQEKVSFQNQLEKLKKDTDKSKGIAPAGKKPGGKAA